MDSKNKGIQNFIDNMDESLYPSKSQIQYLLQYDLCDDYELSDELILSIWDYFKLLKPELETGTSILNNHNYTCLHTHSGAGRMVFNAPTHLETTSYVNDYYCLKTSDLINLKRKEQGNYYSNFMDLAYFYITPLKGNNKKYDIVVCQPPQESQMQKLHWKYTQTTKCPCDFYSEASWEFVRKGGHLVVILPERKLDEFKSKYKLVYEVKPSGKFSDKLYGALIFKK